MAPKRKAESAAAAKKSKKGPAAMPGAPSVHIEACKS